MENFKTNILNTIRDHLDTLKIKNKEEEKVSLAIFYPKCRSKNSKREYPINVVEVCGICTQEHATDQCP